MINFLERKKSSVTYQFREIINCLSQVNEFEELIRQFPLEPVKDLRLRFRIKVTIGRKELFLLVKYNYFLILRSFPS